MSWRCLKCATEHTTDVERASCTRLRRRQTAMVVSVVVVCVVAILGIELAWNQYAFDDWKCAFIECRKVVL